MSRFTDSPYKPPDTRRCLYAMVAGLALLPVARGQPPSAFPTERVQQQLQENRKATPRRTRTASKSSKRVASGNRASTRPSRHSTPQKRPSQTVPVARRQSHPTPERYAEIQAALAKAGYFQDPVDGIWGASSASALANFQQDNGLEPTGKIDALSLIKLDLGPKYESSPVSGDTGGAPSSLPNEKDGNRE